MKEAPAEIDVFLYVRRFHGMKLEAIVVGEEVKKWMSKFGIVL